MISSISQARTISKILCAMIALNFSGCATPDINITSTTADSQATIRKQDAKVTIWVNKKIEPNNTEMTRITRANARPDSDYAWTVAGTKLKEELSSRGIQSVFGASLIPNTSIDSTHIVELRLIQIRETRYTRTPQRNYDRRKWRTNVFEINHKDRKFDLIFSQDYESDDIECFMIREPIGKDFEVCQNAMIKFLADQISSRWQ